MKMSFGKLEIGDRFYDPFSGEYWIKKNQRQAIQNSGGDAYTDLPDEFFLDDKVIVDE